MDSFYDNFNDAARLLLQADYKVAKTMPKNPHSYTLIDTWKNKQDFYDVVKFIRLYGYRQNFFKQVYTYLDVNGHQYWTMGAPLSETILINRAEKQSHSPYDKIADTYDDLFTDPSFKEEDQKLIDSLEIKGRVLDIGCGTGLFLDMYEPEDYLGIDPSQKMLDRLVAKHPSYADKVICTPAERFYDPRGFNTIISLYGSPSYVEPEHLKRIADMLLPGGKAYFMFYKPGYKVYTYEKTGIEPERYPTPKRGKSFTNYQIVTYEY